MIETVTDPVSAATRLVARDHASGEHAGNTMWIVTITIRCVVGLTSAHGRWARSASLAGRPSMAMLTSVSPSLGRIAALGGNVVSSGRTSQSKTVQADDLTLNGVTVGDSASCTDEGVRARRRTVFVTDGRRASETHRVNQLDEAVTPAAWRASASMWSIVFRSRIVAASERRRDHEMESSVAPKRKSRKLKTAMAEQRGEPMSTDRERTSAIKDTSG